MTDAKAPPVSVDAQDPLPESNWVPRRWFCFLALVGLLALLAGALYLDRGIWAVTFLLASIMVLYLIAPSAEQATKMLATASMLKQGVTIRKETTAKAADSEARSLVEATAAPAEPDTGELPADQRVLS